MLFTIALYLLFWFKGIQLIIQFFRRLDGVEPKQRPRKLTPQEKKLAEATRRREEAEAFYEYIHNFNKEADRRGKLAYEYGYKYGWAGEDK